MKLLNWLQDCRYFNLNKSESVNLSEVINIVTIDNPGWYITINMDYTKFEIKTFDLLSIDNGDNDWVFIKINEGKYNGVGDKNKLIYILEFFRKWHQNEIIDNSTIDISIYKNDLLYWLQNDWFCSLNFGWDGMEYYGVKIVMKSNKTWHVEIELLDTFLEDKEFNNVNIYKCDEDWVNINVSNNIFNGCGDKNKLSLIITEFKKWAEIYKD